MSFLSDGFHATVQYSRRGRTYVMKPLIRLLISLERKHFNIQPRVFIVRQRRLICDVLMTTRTRWLAFLTILHTKDSSS